MDSDGSMSGNFGVRTDRSKAGSWMRRARQPFDKNKDNSQQESDAVGCPGKGRGLAAIDDRNQQPRCGDEKKNSFDATDWPKEIAHQSDTQKNRAGNGADNREAHFIPVADQQQ